MGLGMETGNGTQDMNGDGNGKQDGNGNRKQERDRYTTPGLPKLQQKCPFMCRTEVDSVYYLVEIASLVSSNGSGVFPQVSSGRRCSQPLFSIKFTQLQHIIIQQLNGIQCQL